MRATRETKTLARYNGSKINEEWLYSGSTVALQRTKDEPK
ncbi:hypothetical protein HMPREF1320_0588 [Capnocytophaga sp. oral taxon 335 str. F0486]|nr:hypothetical protein HMPREF1320_0588 [Capnocytophaga sp. oral taxon 335 str. F0486]